jgi:hypothetical protein
MSTTSSSPDVSSKRWLMLFASAAVVTIVVLAYSFLNALAPSQEVVEPQPKKVREPYTSSQPVWDHAQQNRSTEYPNNIPPTPPGERPATTIWVTPTNWMGMVHMQSEYLRKLAAESKDPNDINRLTPEQIDEMEKKGLLIQ